MIIHPDETLITDKIRFEFFHHINGSTTIRCSWPDWYDTDEQIFPTQLALLILEDLRNRHPQN